MTHEVFNQAPPLVDTNLYLSDAVLVDAVKREGGAWGHEDIAVLGAVLGTAQAQQWATDANEHEPRLHTHDRFGNRRDEVEFHPGWHELMRTSVTHHVHSLPWVDHRDGAHVVRAALMMITAENELGHTCPISMTYSGIAALNADPQLAGEWLPRLTSAEYDSRFGPADGKTGALLGMGMTEKQGGSDVRANTTRAERIGDSAEYLITGHKWFCSAPMCDAFLILAQAPRGLTCFFLPRWTPGGKRNRFEIQRLKRKLGNRSNASSEVEFTGAWARLLGEEGRGVATIIEMVQHTRLDCVLGSAALMRGALVEAVHHARHRSAFGKRLIHQPLMRSVLADLALESAAATVLAMRLARAFDRRSGTLDERAFARIATAIAKYWVCKRAPAQVGEALECLGGNGYVDDSVMPRLYREAPLYSIWEGSGNVICLDVLRALQKEPACRDALAAELENTGAIPTEVPAEADARGVVERIAVELQASLLNRAGLGDAAAALRRARAGNMTFGSVDTVSAGLLDT